MEYRLQFASDILYAKLNLILIFDSETKSCKIILSIIDKSLDEAIIYRDEIEADSIEDGKKKAIRRAASVFNSKVLRFKPYVSILTLEENSVKVALNHEQSVGYFIIISSCIDNQWFRVIKEHRKTKPSAKTIEYLVRKHTGKDITWLR